MNALRRARDCSPSLESGLGESRSGALPRTRASIIYENIGVIRRDDARIAGGCTNHIASYFEFGTDFRVLSRAHTKFNPTLWVREQSEFKFGISTLFSCEEKRMQS
jgi:hypothetical protein